MSRRLRPRPTLNRKAPTHNRVRSPTSWRRAAGPGGQKAELKRQAGSPGEDPASRRKRRKRRPLRRRRLRPARPHRRPPPRLRRKRRQQRPPRKRRRRRRAISPRARDACSRSMKSMFATRPAKIRNAPNVAAARVGTLNVATRSRCSGACPARTGSGGAKRSDDRLRRGQPACPPRPTRPGQPQQSPRRRRPDRRGRPDGAAAGGAAARTGQPRLRQL